MGKGFRTGPKTTNGALIEQGGMVKFFSPKS